MSEDIEDLVIETGVDSVMDYLAEHGKASCSEISDDIGVDEERVKSWGNALADEDLVEKHHTLTSGLVLEYSTKNLEEASRKKAEIEEELDEKSDDLKSELEDKSEEVHSTREELIEKRDSLDEEEKEAAVDETVERLEELETRIDRRLKSDTLDRETLKLISEVERVLKQVEELIKKHITEEQGKKLDKKSQEAVSEVENVLEMAEQSEEFSEDQEEIRKKIKAVKKLESNIEKARENHSGSGSSMGIIGKIKALIPIKKTSSSDSVDVSAEEVKEVIDDSQKIKKDEVPEQTYQELVDENRVTEVMRKMSLIKDPDYESILKAETYNQNRPELTSYLKERVENGG